MLENVLNIFLEITFILLIISSVLFGISLALNLFISTTIIKIKKQSDKNFQTIDVDKSKKCLGVINSAKTDFLEYKIQLKEKKKIIKINKFRKFLRLKEKEIKEPSINQKDIFINLAKSISEVFNSNGKTTSYLSLSEQDIFMVLLTIKDRLEKLVTSADVIWLKKMPISVMVYAINVYNEALKFKNKFLVALIFKIMEFISWFSRFLSPVSVSRYFLKSLSGDTLSDILSNSFIEIIGKELSVIYKNKDEKDYKLQI